MIYPGITLFINLFKHKMYWVFQFSGWTAAAVFGFILIHSYIDTHHFNLVSSLVIYASVNLFISHLLKERLIRQSWLENNPYQIFQTLMVFVLTATALNFTFTYIPLIIVYQSLNILSNLEIIIAASITFIFYTIWISLYTLSKLFINYRKTESEKLNLELNLLKSELSFLKSQIKPHFIFNAINNISSLISENPQKARESLSALSTFLRTSINPENNLAVPLEKEISVVKGYLQLQKIQLGNRLHVKWDNNEPQRHYHIPFLGFQTLVENSFKHGSFCSNSENILEIKFTESPSSLTIIIKNPGKLKGRLHSQNGTGLNNLKRRLQLLDCKSSLTLSQETDHTVSTKLILYQNEYMYN
jgi:LytS/YehU family sensor histidine kinase